MAIDLLAVSCIHFALCDGYHDYDVVKEEIKSVDRHQSVGGMIIFDDYDGRMFPGIVHIAKPLAAFGRYEGTAFVAQDERGNSHSQKL